jgi:hypothetical protein
MGVYVFRFSGILSHFIDDVRFFFNFRPELFLKVIVIIDRGNRMGNDDDDDVLFHPLWVSAHHHHQVCVRVQRRR